MSEFHPLSDIKRVRRKNCGLKEAKNHTTRKKDFFLKNSLVIEFFCISFNFPNFNFHLLDITERMGFTLFVLSELPTGRSIVQLEVIMIKGIVAN